MPCFDVGARPDKSVPPKKSHSWRVSQNRTSLGEESVSNNSPLENKDSMSDSRRNLPFNMGSNTTQSDSQNGNHQRFEQLSPTGCSSADVPLDFSIKPNPRNSLPGDKIPVELMSPRERHSSGYNSREFPPLMLNGGHRYSHFDVGCETRISNGRDHQQATSPPKRNYQPRKSAVSPKMDRNGSFDMIKSEELNDIDLRSSSTGGRSSSYSPPLHSPNVPSKSPILACMLSKGSPDVMPTMPIDLLNPRFLALGLQNGYSNGNGSMCLPAGPSSGITPSAIFPPSNMISTPGMAFMQPPMNMLSPVAPLPQPIAVENKAPRKGKQERPFKNYDVSLQDDLRWLQMGPRPNVASPPPEAQPPAPINVPQRNGISCINMNGNSNSSNSDPPSGVSDMDNTSHNRVCNVSPPSDQTGTVKSRNRKRKPVADSEKDANYWERRKKNNQAAKRSRENRRIKEDTVAQQALYFRNETSRLSQILLHLNARIHDISLKCASLEQDKLTLTAENAMFKQIVTQKRCGQCGNHLSDKLL